MPSGGVDINAGETGLSHLITGLTNGTSYTFTVTATNAVGTSTSSTASNSVTPMAPIIYYTLEYSANSFGSITGSSTQVIASGGSGSEVTAIPDDNYHFIGWSDGATSVNRVDNNVVTNLNFIANFAINEENNYSNNAVSLPAAIGDGVFDAVIPMNSSIDIMPISSSGVNILAYINSQAGFKAPESSNHWHLNEHHFQIVNLDLFSKIITLNFHSEPQTLSLKIGENRRIDLDNDGINDIRVTFTDIYINRAEIAIKSLEDVDIKGTVLLDALNMKEVTDGERSLIKNINVKLTNRLNGRILLQIEEKGQAWYLEPLSKQKYFMGRAGDAFNLMRKFGLGISNDNLDKFLATKAPNNLSGRIFLAVERNGEAYYVNPVDLKLYYLGHPDNAYQMMRDLALGISNENIRQIEVAEIN
jgi:hypothetical protein